ncbi:hypothetical protein B0T16DRAFT_50235 [Cercophora newfieldiana]|uniref:Uncharacterized protein n=1 Tax=Cercophora newfieldiana TaxID=92897 RepID=A0AA40D0A5_9PEZI|nr:hypothetical protein B0T16DRAFT_50235 [Cercophora newfieldiana]
MDGRVGSYRWVCANVSEEWYQPWSKERAQGGFSSVALVPINDRWVHKKHGRQGSATTDILRAQQHILFVFSLPKEAGAPHIDGAMSGEETGER